MAIRTGGGRSVRSPSALQPRSCGSAAAAAAPGSLQSCLCVGAASPTPGGDTMVSALGRVRPEPPARRAGPDCPGESSAPRELGTGTEALTGGGWSSPSVCSRGGGNAGARCGDGRYPCFLVGVTPRRSAPRLPRLGKGTCGLGAGASRFRPTPPAAGEARGSRPLRHPSQDAQSASER